MYIIPGIDLIGGRCVRLIQGRYDRQLIYRDDPVEQAQEFALAGAKWLQRKQGLNHSLRQVSQSNPCQLHRHQI
ncbi:MAG: hypothetical protein JXB29_03050 [Sedimentisphaerales bacterium]|nr:hypothetical protein [Sedimentisphaerales bacterium]